jgi:hypothetical protein
MSYRNPRLLNANNSAVDKDRFTAKSKHSGHVNPGTYSRVHLMAEIRATRDQASGLGFFITALMQDSLISFEKQSMLEDLADQMMKASVGNDQEVLKRLMSAYKYLESREDFTLREIGNDTEAIIDETKGIVKDGVVSQKERLAEQVRWMYEQTQCVPACFTIGGWKGTGRLPESLLEKNPVIARTNLCKLLERISGGIRALEDAMLDVEWSLTRPVPQECLAFLRAHPLAQSFDAYAGELRRWWYEQWQNLHQPGSDQVMDDQAIRSYYRNLESQLEVMLQLSPYNPSELREYVAVALMARIYTTEYPGAPEAGRHYPDGLLWTRPIGKALMQAFDSMGLSGKIAKIDFHVGNRAYGSTIIDVHVKSGVVMIRDNGKVIGLAGSVPDGDYQAKGGLIIIKPAHKLLKQDSLVEEAVAE